jgi:hypothetical protein
MQMSLKTSITPSLSVTPSCKEQSRNVHKYFPSKGYHSEIIMDLCCIKYDPLLHYLPRSQDLLACFAITHLVFPKNTFYFILPYPPPPPPKPRHHFTYCVMGVSHYKTMQLKERLENYTKSETTVTW